MAARGLRNNNPLNLSYLQGQPGVTGSDGRFGTYANLTDGVAANYNQLLIDQQRHGLNTVAQIIGDPTHGWSPASENGAANTQRYITAVSNALGVGPNDTIDLRDPVTAQKMIQAMSVQEGSGQLDPNVVAAGVSRINGQTTAPIPTMTVTPGGATGATGATGAGTGSTSTALTTTNQGSSATGTGNALGALAVISLIVIALLWSGISGTIKHVSA